MNRERVLVMKYQQRWVARLLLLSKYASVNAPRLSVVNTSLSPRICCTKHWRIRIESSADRKLTFRQKSVPATVSRYTSASSAPMNMGSNEIRMRAKDAA